MMNKYLLLAFLLLGNLVAVQAQEDDSKYLKGAVPLVDGRVVMTRDVLFTSNSNLSKKKMFALIEEWANKEYTSNEEGIIKRVLVTSAEEGYVACQGDDYLVFKSAALVLDRAKIYYQLIVRAEDNGATLEFKNIKYDYQDYKKTVSAEEMITDEYALNKQETKLNRYYDKFRTFSIDHIDGVTENLRNFLANKISNGGEAVVQTVAVSSVASATDKPKASGEVITAVSVIKQETMADFNYKQMSLEDLSDDVVAMFKDNWALVVANEKAMPAAWSGLGSFGGKPVAMSVVKDDASAVETYTISFFTPIHKSQLDKIAKGEKSNLTSIVAPSGAKAFAEAWMIIECKKVLEQPTTDAMSDGIQSRKWAETNFNKLFMGEIINIWAR